MTLSDYIRRRNGVRAGARGSLRQMFSRSLGAGSFAGFWRHWNPLFGYLLGRHVFVPLKRLMPPAPALVLTFVVCGAIHDLVTTAVRGSVAFFFTLWFLLLAVGLLIGRAVRMDLSSWPWVVRAAANIVYVGACLAGTIALKRLFTM